MMKIQLMLGTMWAMETIYFGKKIQLKEYDIYRFALYILDMISL